MAYQRAMEGRPSPCRFTPSCSSYAVESLRLHGSLRGSWLTLRRLLRCRPFGPSGWDPVPLPTPDRHAAPSSPLTSHSTTLTTSHTSPHSTPRQDKGLFA